MRMHPAEFLRSVRAVCDEFEVPLIADEVLTGFGRTGSLFACQRAGIGPDVLCLAKGLSGGTFPIAATLASGALFEAFRSRDHSRAFFHGHTFTAHPVGCAVALASLELCREDDVPARLEALGRRIEARLADARGDLELRRTGGIVAFDLPAADPGYLSTRCADLRRRSLELGVLLRPLGNVLYALPPACTTEAQADRIADVMAELAE
jgi:adenosylmethionine-8-amino-7-oxononanoate aminotransferase